MLKRRRLTPLYSSEAVIAEAMTAKLVMQFRAGNNLATTPKRDKLTPRERETMVCLARGESNKEIARHLNRDFPLGAPKVLFER